MHYYTRSLELNEPCETRNDVSPEDVVMLLKNGSLIYGEGKVRRVIAVNGTRPGPTLVVNQGATVTVTVINNLMTEVRE